MLGHVVRDPEGIEGPPGETEGLGLLDLETVMTRDKMLTEVQAVDALSGQALRGYEMHMGRTTGPGLDRPWFRLDDRPEGAMSDDGRVMGSYLHGVFGADGFRSHWISTMGGRASGLDHSAQVEATLDALADQLEEDLDLDALLALAK